MQLAAHPAAQRLIDELVLLQARLAAKLLGDDVGPVVVAVAGEVLDPDLRVGQALAGSARSISAALIGIVAWLLLRPRLRPPCRPGSQLSCGVAQLLPPIWGVSVAEDQRVAAGAPDHAGEHAGAAAAAEQVRRVGSRARPAGSGPDPRRTTSRSRCGVARQLERRRRWRWPGTSRPAATASPPSDRSWQARTRPAAIWSQHELAGAPLGGEIDRRRRAVVAADQLLPVERAAEPAQALAEQNQVEARLGPGDADHAVQDRRSRRGRRHWGSAGSPVPSVSL